MKLFKFIKDRLNKNKLKKFTIEYTLSKKINKNNNPLENIKSTFGKPDYILLNIVFLDKKNEVIDDFNFNEDNIELSFDEKYSNLDRIEFYLKNKNKTTNIYDIEYIISINDGKTKKINIILEKPFETIYLGNLSLNKFPKFIS